MKKTLYTFLVWDFLLFAMGLSELIFYRDLTLREGAVVSWTQPALVSLTSFLILISIYYGLYQLFFGKRFCMKTEMDAEELEAFRSQTLNFLKKEKIDPGRLQKHLRYLIAAESILWGVFLVYLFVSETMGGWCLQDSVQRFPNLTAKSFSGTPK